MSLRYIEGDATRPVGAGPRLIAHVCNDIGAWGAGFVIAVSRRWDAPEREYLASRPALGGVQFVSVGDGIVVANMVAQAGIGIGTTPLRYSALVECLDVAGEHAHIFGASVHMPRIGCGLAGGKWEFVERLLLETLVWKRKLDVTVYDLPGARP